MSTVAITSISLPFSLDKELKKAAKVEHRTKSGFIQEAVRYYLESKKWKHLQRDIGLRAERMGIRSEDDIEALIDDVRQ